MIIKELQGLFTQMHKIDATHSIEDTHFIGSSVQYTHLNYSCVSQKSLCQHSLLFLRNLYWQEKCQEVCWQSCSGSALAASLPQDSFPLSLHFAGKQLICAMSETKPLVAVVPQVSLLGTSPGSSQPQRGLLWQPMSCPQHLLKEH